MDHGSRTDDAPNEKPETAGVTRRAFMELSIATTVLAGAQRLAWDQSAEPRPEHGGVPYRTLGRTGEKVSIVGIGGFHLGRPEEQEAIRIVRTALDNGVNFLDNCWDYNNGKSEIRMGQALAGGYRQKAFLMTKIDGRTKTSAVQQLDESLRRLQTDHVDLLQLHEIIRRSDPDRIFGESGALEAVVAAKKAGKVRYIGFTGHKSPEIHLEMLATAAAHDFTFDTVQMPLNVMDAHYNSFEKRVLPAALSRHMGVLGMKPMGDHVILTSKAVTAAECLRYAMSLPTSVVITGCDSLPILEQALSVARAFKPMSASEVTALLAKTERAAGSGQFELYKTSDHFDSTSHHPEWLG
jgi:predicted aldo/keto reductase-like oxidoreductase